MIEDSKNDFIHTRMGLLQFVADCLGAESERSKTHNEKALDYAKLVDWLRVCKLIAPSVTGAILGNTPGGPVGTIIGAVGGLFKSEGSPSEEDLKKVENAYITLLSELADLFKDKEAMSLPEIKKKI